MISRQHRFHGHSSVRRVYRVGRGVRSGQLGLKYAQGKSVKPWKLAVVVSRKVHKSAVVRNRIRRRLFEAVRVAELQPIPGSELVMTVYSDAVAKMPSPALQMQVASLLQKSGTTTPVEHAIVGTNSNQAGD